MTMKYVGNRYPVESKKYYTKEEVDALLAGVSYAPMPIVPVVANTVMNTGSYSGAMVVANSSSPTNITLTIPADATYDFANGTQISLTGVGTGTVTVAAASGVTLLSTPGNKLRTRYSSATLVKLADNQWLLIGDLSA
jgi:hypothetical protein